MRKVLRFLIIGVLLVSCQYASSQIKQTTIILVRHAEKGEGKDPSLNDQGKARATRLNNLLKSDITALYSTNYNRTKETLQPISNRLNLDILIYNPFAEGEIEKIVNNNRGGVVLISGHSNTTPHYVNTLMGKNLFDSTLHENDYSNIFIVTLGCDKGASLITLNY